MDISDMGLTHRQIVAVALVFYGGIKKIGRKNNEY
jgi:hypothetical protein